MDRLWGGVLGAGVLAVLAVATVECVRMAREVLELERDRRSRSAGPVERPGLPSSPVDVPGPAVDELGDWPVYLDDETAAAARRAIAHIAGEPE